MGKVAVLLKITPKPDYDVDKLKENLENEIEIEDIQKKNIGFGLSVLKTLVLIPDTDDGDTDKLENKISGIEGVKRAEVEDINLL
ncbi:MAG: elongation factor 1-beta [Candidatus Aenigmatarchaeota archaeon]